MDESNFFVETKGNMCILNFKDVEESFFSYTMSSNDNHFKNKVAKYLDWPAYIRSACMAGGILIMPSDTTLGMLALLES